MKSSENDTDRVKRLPRTKEFHLATYITIAITFLVVVSTLTVSGVLFFSLDKSLTTEFEERVKAEGREAGQALTNRLHRIETRLKALTLDNTIRVTLMLGALQQLEEHLQAVYTNDSDLHFLIEEEKTKSYFTASTFNFDRYEIVQALATPPADLKLENDSSRLGFNLTYSLPIFRQQDRIGKAAVVYLFNKDKFLESVLGRDESRKLIIVRDGTAWDLLSGKALSIPESHHNGSEKHDEIRYLTIDAEDFAAISREELPGLYFVTHLKSLDAAKQRVLFSVMLPALSIIMLALFVSFFLSRKLTQALQQLSRLALKISRGEPELPGDVGFTRIVEVNRLETSLRTMLNHLRLAREMERYQELFEGVADIVFIHDLAGTIVEVNDVAATKLGFTKNELTSRKLADIVSSQQLEHLQTMLHSLRRQKEQIVFTTQLVDSSGKGMFVECHARQIIFKDQEVVLNVVRDISDRMLAEEALKESHRTLLTVLDGIQATIYVDDLETHEILFMNKYMKDVFGNNLVGKKCYEVFCRLPEPCGQCTNDTLLNSDDRLTKVITWEGQNPITGKWNINYDRLISWIDGRLVKFQIAFDITGMRELEQERDQAESQLRKVQKMEAIATLAGGVAHDLNNILSGVVSYPDLLLLQLPEDSHLRTPLMTIKDTGLKAAAIVQDLLTLARRGVVAYEVIDFNEVVSDYLASPEYKRLIQDHQNIVVKVDLQSDLLNILGSFIHLSKTIMNLTTNAAEAIQGSGTITITTATEIIGASSPYYPKIKKGEYIVLSVSDDGCGISAKDGERIFEPFFTTKIMGRSGTGLGMAVVWGTVEDHEGYIDLESALDKGTTFKLFFPVTRKELLKEQLAISQHDFNGRGESILVVDDVKEQREIASLMFSELGYKVLTVASGEEAVAHLTDNSVNLILLDMIMDGGMNGLETYKEIIKIHPGQKTIVATGYSKTEHVKEAIKLGVGQYIKKPYLFEEIALAVKSELGKNDITG